MRRLSRLPAFLAAHWPVIALALVLALAVLIVSPRKPFWNDELFSWYFVTADFTTLRRAFNDALNNSPFLYFGFGWLWTHVFGASELSLRLFSSLGISLAAIALWPLLTRSYGFWAAALGILGTFCTSELALSQNVEARMYGLFLALVALAIVLYDRLCRAETPPAALLVLNAIVHAALVHTHLFGLFYSGAVAAAFVATRFLAGGFDLRQLHSPLRVHVSFVAAWLSFLLYLPAFQAQAEAGRPYSWLPRPVVEDLTALLTHATGSFLRPEIFALLVVVAAVHLLLVPVVPARAPAAPRPDDRHLVTVALALVALPVAIWIASRHARPIFFDRYLMPSLLGWTILIAHVMALLLPPDLVARMSQAWLLRARSLLLSAAALGLLAYPLVEARSYRGGNQHGSDDHLLGHQSLPLVVQTLRGFLERIHSTPNPGRYFFVLDWEATNSPASGRFGIQEHKHMDAWRRAFPEIFAAQIVESDEFLSAHDAFLVLTYPDYRRQCAPAGRGVGRLWEGMHCPQWVARRIADNPAFDIREIAAAQDYVVLLVRQRTEASAELPHARSKPTP